MAHISRGEYSRKYGEGHQRDGQTEDGDGAADVTDGGQRHLVGFR